MFSLVIDGGKHYSSKRCICVQRFNWRTLMMKGKRSLSLVMSILAITSLTACDDEYKYPDNKWKDGLIVTVAGKE